MKIKYTYEAQKMFAIGEEIYQKGDILELTHQDAESHIQKGRILPHLEKEIHNQVIDTKGIEDVLRNSLDKYAPKNEEKATFPEFLKAISTNSVDKLVEQKAITVGTDAQGGFCATSLTDSDVDVDLIASSGLAQLATTITLSGTNNTYKFNLLDSLDTGGTVISYVAESGAISVKQPRLVQFEISLIKATFAMYVSSEAAEDTASLVQEIVAQLPEEVEKLIENGMINGDSAFTGIVGSSATLVVSPETSQTDSTIQSENIDKMMAAIKNMRTAVWVCSRSAFEQLIYLKNEEGDKMWEMDGTRFGRLRGIPVLVSNASPQVGQVGDLILCSPNRYRIASKGMKVASSTHYRYLNDEETLKMTWRLGGKPCSVKLTTSDSETLADFVVLADRGDAEFGSSSSSSSSSVDSSSSSSSSSSSDSTSSSSSEDYSESSSSA